MSKFAGVIAAKRDADTVPEKPQEAASTPVTPKAPPKVRNVESAATEPPKRGRPPAKRSDPDYVQTTAYILGKTHRDVKIALLNEGQGREYSELVEELLAKWLKTQQSKNVKD